MSYKILYYFIIVILIVVILKTKEIFSQGSADKKLELTRLANQNPVIKLDGNKFRNLVLTNQKEYTVIALLTALDSRYGCSVCVDGAFEFKIVAKSYWDEFKADPNIFFVLLDVDSARDVFEQMRMKTVPHIVEFKRRMKNEAVQFDVRKYGFEAEHIAKWIRERVDVKINIYRQVDFKPIIGMVFVGVLFVVSSLLFRKSILNFLSRRIFGIFILGIIFVFTSGQMWNKIRHPPWFVGGRHSKSYIYGGSDMQLVAETLIIAAIYASFAAGMILLNAAPTFKIRRKFKILLAFTGLAIMAVFYSLMLSIFKKKHRGYPYNGLFEYMGWNVL